MLGAIIGDVAGSYYEVLEVQEVKQKRKRTNTDKFFILDNIKIKTIETLFIQRHKDI